MKKFYVRLSRLGRDANPVVVPVYGKNSDDVYDAVKLMYPGLEVGYPTKYEPMPGSDPNICNRKVYEEGISIGMFDMPKEEAEALCKRLTEETGLLHDWHYFGGRVVIKRLNK